MINIVKALREELHIRPGKFAKDVHISRSHLWDIERFGAEPSVSVAQRIAKELKKPVDVVFPCPKNSVSNIHK